MIQASLRTIAFDDIQLLRFWRNLDHVRRHMILTRYIDRNEQRHWFETSNENLVRYFIYSLDTHDVGCANLLNINQTEKSFEGGIFCGDTTYLNHWVNIWACIKIYDYGFFELGLETSFAKVLKDNLQALKLNKSLGYQFIKDIDQNIGWYVLTRDDYIQSTVKIKRYLREFVKQTL